MCFYQNLVLVAEYHVDLLTNTAVTSAVTNSRCHKLIANVIKSKNSNIEIFICNQYAEKFAILNTENVKIRGSITKLKLKTQGQGNTSISYYTRWWVISAFDRKAILFNDRKRRQIKK